MTVSRPLLRAWRRAVDTKADRIKRTLFLLAAILINLGIAALVVWVVKQNVLLIKGSDSMYHVYRGSWIYKEVSSGNLWPLYNPVWYNGVELLRYWPPAAAYLMALCQWIASFIPQFADTGIAFSGFAVYCGFIFFIGAISWTIVGLRKRRMVFGALIGILWFFMPTGIHVLFGEGNLPRSLIMAFFPLLFMFVNEYLKKGEKKDFIGTAVMFFVMNCCHVGYTGMVAIACLIYLFVYRLCCFAGSTRLEKGKHKDLDLIIAIVSGFLISGIFLYPALNGGLVSNSGHTDQTAKSFFQSMYYTLNPWEKFSNGFADVYFGIASFLVAIFGLIGAKRRARPGFITAVIIVLLTSNTAYPIVSSLPGGQFLWMARFLQIGSAMILFSMLEWDSLKKPIIAVITVLLILDCFSVSPMLRKTEGINRVEDYYTRLEDEMIIDDAKKDTHNRIAVMDSGRVILNGVYYLTDYNGGVPQIFGQGWEAASTSKQIAQINEAFDYGYYYFMFDRLVEMGSDTVLVRKDAPMKYPYNEEEAEAAALATGYEKIRDEGTYAVFSLKGIDGKYGTVSKYKGIAIGDGAYYITMMFPAIEESPSKYVDDFTVEELSKYPIIYMDGFKYHNVDKAEDIIRQVSKNGSKVYILADGMPVNEKSKTNRFLGVESQSIEFDNGFPTLMTKKLGTFEVALFPDEYRQWKTVYMNGLSEIEGWSEVLGETLPFYGKGENENITFVGYNLTYYFSITKDRNIGSLLSGIVQTSTTELPERKTVPLDITYTPRYIAVYSPEDNVNTTLAVHDIFKGNYKEKNRLVYVDKGRTEIYMHYPYLVQSILMSVFGIAVVAVTAVFIKPRGKKERDSASKK